MEDLLCDNQGYAAQQQRVSDMIIRSLKDILPSVLGEIKELASLKKALEGNGDWKTTKEILGWVVNTHKGSMFLPSKRKAKILSLLDIPPTHRRMLVKSLERLIVKLRSIHLAVPGAIGHFYAMQVALTWA